MGTNNRQRRAAKQRKRARQRGERSRPTPGPDPFTYGSVELRVSSTVRRLGREKYDEATLRHRAETLLRSIQPQPRQVAEVVLADMLGRLTTTVLDGGWDRADLEQLVGRGADEGLLPTLFAVLGDERLRLDTIERFASGLQIAALLSTAPLLDAETFPTWCASDHGEVDAHPKLARVRALLAKAESTDYDEEAEALTAKAQELITRYALGRLVESGGAGRAGGGDLRVRRLWLDAPYLRAKATLVHEVSGANRCRSASAESFGFALVVGSQADLDAVELLVTSLLVQAGRAMLRHGRRFDHGGRSRTRSFRQSFLVAYAVRIGERLRSATADAVSASDAERLLPVLRDHEETVSEAFDAMVPHTVGRATSATDGEGWAAGVAAADLALLDVNGTIDQRAG